MLLRYVGPHDGVFIPLPSGREITVERGGQFEVDDDEFAAGLLNQPSNFERVEKPKPDAKQPGEKSDSPSGGKG